MPIGSYAHLPWLTQALLEGRPQTVLDLGMGFGGGGVIVREWLDLGVQPWRTYLVGVEVWAEYRNPVWDLYDTIYVQTIEAFLRANTERFEAILFGDVLEHFDKTVGHAVLNDLKEHVADNGHLFVSTPAEFFPQGAVYGNDWEKHRSLWSEEELAACGLVVQRTGSPDFACRECLFATWHNSN